MKNRSKNQSGFESNFGGLGQVLEQLEVAENDQNLPELDFETTGSGQVLGEGMLEMVQSEVDSTHVFGPDDDLCFR